MVYEYEKMRLAVAVGGVASALASRWIGFQPYFMLAGFWVILTLMKKQQEQFLLSKEKTVIPFDSHISLPEFVNNLEHY